ncbi:MAG TPA: hypothetical protein VG651_20865 [Stellaceae bacterium]|nr:hypothetical protein [Stellaceae bacterium]
MTWPAAADRSGIGSTRLVLAATLVVPLLLLVAGCLSYRAAYRAATAAAQQAVAVAADNTTKVLDAHWLVAARIADLLGTMRDDRIRAAEKTLHDRMAQQIAAMPEVAAAWVIDRNGRELVSARVYPVNSALDQSGRDDFRALHDPAAAPFIWVLRARRLDDGEFAPYVTISLRRPARDGQFDGIIVVAVSGDYFASFYNALIDRDGYSAALARSDGVILERYPPAAGPPAPLLPDPLTVQAIAQEPQAGITANGTPFDGAGRIVAIKRVANYPVYVTFERSKASIFTAWLRSITGYAAIALPAALGLIAAGFFAYRHARRAQFALAQARKAFAGRAALEARLDRARRLEAVGLLAAGVAKELSDAVSKADNDRAAAMTRRLLALARYDALKPRPLDLNEVIVGLLELRWPSGDCIISEAGLQADLWPVRVDPDQFAAVLLNFAFHPVTAKDNRLIVETGNCPLGAGAVDRVPPGDYVGVVLETAGGDKGDGERPNLSSAQAFAAQSGGYCVVDGTRRAVRAKLYLPRYLATREGLHDRPPQDHHHEGGRLGVAA